MRAAALIVVAAVLMGAAAFLGITSARRAPGQGLSAGLREVPDFRLTAATSDSQRPLSRADLAGRPWIADFIFASCAGPCPLLSANMARLQARLPSAVRLVSFTVDPDRDTPKALKAYARRFRADPSRWYFLTGDKRPLYKLLSEGFKLATVEDPGAPSGLRVSHSTKFVLVDARGVLRGYYDGDDPDALARLEQDAASLSR